MPKLREAPGYPSTGADGDTSTVDRMATLSIEDLLGDLDEFLRRAENGEEFTITVSGHAVAKLGPARQQWIDRGVLEELAKLPVDPTFMEDIERFDFDIRDPWEE